MGIPMKTANGCDPPSSSSVKSMMSSIIAADEGASTAKPAKVHRAFTAPHLAARRSRGAWLRQNTQVGGVFMQAAGPAIITRVANRRNFARWRCPRANTDVALPLCAGLRLIEWQSPW